MCVWAEQDSNLRRREPTDLQSVPFDRFGIDPFKIKRLNPGCFHYIKFPVIVK